ncbi:MAG: hypothetical protein AB2L24_21705 [Mangrovibacterium sp.]
MKTKDVKIIDDLIERFNDLEDVSDFQVEYKWKKLTDPEEKKQLFKTHKSISQIRIDLRAFINQKFDGRQDLMEHLDSIVFDTGPWEIRSASSIREIWFSGMNKLEDLLDIVKSEVYMEQKRKGIFDKYIKPALKFFSTIIIQIVKSIIP